jgi:hypothetical protein
MIDGRREGEGRDGEIFGKWGELSNRKLLLRGWSDTR